MKTAVSIPDDLFVRADKYAHNHQLSRSAVFAAALAEFLKSRQRVDLIDKINEAVDLIGEQPDEVLINKSKGLLRRLEW